MPIGPAQFVDGLPVVSAAGTPEEIGQQLGTLLKDPITSLLDKKNDIAHGFGLSQAPNLLGEDEPFGRAGVSGRTASRNRGLGQIGWHRFGHAAFANIMYEVSHFPAVRRSRLKQIGPRPATRFFGRNLDFPTFGFLDKYSLIEVIRPQGKHAFASITFPGIVGVFSG